MSSRNKEELQRQQREEARARRRQPAPLRRAAPTREQNPVLLILCQGEVTEVEYFRHFELATATVEAVGRAYDPEKLVEEALTRREAARRARQPYDQVWCVFDKDDTEPGRFHAAIQRAQAMGVHVAYSNQCFEFWLLLHFTEHPGGGLRRELCGNNLEALIQAANPRVRYDARKGKHISRDLFELLEAHDPAARPPGQSRRALAVRRAEAIAARWQASGQPPAQQESNTWVYKLVQVLEKHLPGRV